MDTAGREMQVRTFVEEVWNGRDYQAVSDVYADTYVNPFGIGPAARGRASPPAVAQAPAPHAVPAWPTGTAASTPACRTRR